MRIPANQRRTRPGIILSEDFAGGFAGKSKMSDIRNARHCEWLLTAAGINFLVWIWNMECLCPGAGIRFSERDNIVYEELDYNDDNVFNVMFHAGYLTATTFDGEKDGLIEVKNRPTRSEKRHARWSICLRSNPKVFRSKRKA